MGDVDKESATDKESSGGEATGVDEIEDEAKKRANTKENGQLLDTIGERGMEDRDGEHQERCEGPEEPAEAVERLEDRAAGDGEPCAKREVEERRGAESMDIGPKTREMGKSDEEEKIDTKTTKSEKNDGSEKDEDHKVADEPQRAEERSIEMRGRSPEPAKTSDIGDRGIPEKTETTAGREGIQDRGTLARLEPLREGEDEEEDIPEEIWDKEGAEARKELRTVDGRVPHLETAEEEETGEEEESRDGSMEEGAGSAEEMAQEQQTIDRGQRRERGRELSANRMEHDDEDGADDTEGVDRSRE